MLTNYQKRPWMDLRGASQIRDTPSGTPLRSGDNNEQYGGISQVSIKPQANKPQADSPCVNYMSGIHNYIPLDALGCLQLTAKNQS